MWFFFITLFECLFANIQTRPFIDNIQTKSFISMIFSKSYASKQESINIFWIYIQSESELIQILN